MTAEEPQYLLEAFGPIEDGASVGLPDAGPDDCMIAFRAYGIPVFGEGGHITVLVDGDTSQMIAHGSLHLEGGFNTPADIFQAYRPGWWPEWENPADATQWFWPNAGNRL
ncbi:hypothetical protein [Arthrobacter dokdonensis]|uniref:hypothetical protein n=1 Tax=Arthrobacter dokdonellae TaxID=2211210 RepID=UPI000DE58600|nr:hypothetical protein [Arthrobacter dokdonellae]